MINLMRFLGMWVYQKIAVLTCVLLILLGLFPAKVIFISEIGFPVLWIVFYFWIIYRPSFLTLSNVFLLGLFSDLIFITPFGLNTFSFVLFYGMVSAWRYFLLNRNFIFLWKAFFVFVCPTMIVQYLMASLFSLHFMILSDLLMQMLLLIGCYPFVMAIMIKLFQPFMRD